MTDNAKPTPSLDLERIVESARRLGIELNEDEALQWMTALASLGSSMDISVDTGSGVFGNKIVMLDFSPHELAYFREIGRLVEFEDQPGVVETALALSGSSAQSKIQTYPGDCDFFERVNIIAATREEACQILARIMREKVLKTIKGATYQLLEVKFGNYPSDVLRGDHSIRAGAPISWTPEEIQSGKIEARLLDGTPANISWEQAALDPGWCKLDWVVADPAHGRLSNASNMLMSPGRRLKEPSSRWTVISTPIFKRYTWMLARYPFSPSLPNMCLQMLWMITSSSWSMKSTST
jgi:hypothetical protein